MSHRGLLAKPENFTPPTWKPEDCICGAKGVKNAARTLIANCPCCDGMQTLVESDCNCDNPSHFRVILLPNATMRIRRIENVNAIE